MRRVDGTIQLQLYVSNLLVVADYLEITSRVYTAIHYLHFLCIRAFLPFSHFWKVISD